MSDRVTVGKRKYLLLIVPILLLLGWFAFAPGTEQKNTDTKNTKTAQKEDDRKDSNKEQKPKTDDGEVEAASTTEPSTSTSSTTTTSTWKPSPNVKVASVVTGSTNANPPQQPTQPQQPAPQDPQTPPADDEETPPNEEPMCEAYEGQILALEPGTASECFILTAVREGDVCWLPDVYALDDESEPTNLSDKPVVGKPYIVIENANVAVDPEDWETVLCPVYDSYLQFHVYAPENATSTDQPVVDYDYFLPVVNFDPELGFGDPNLEPNEVLVDVQDEGDVTCNTACQEALVL